MSDPSPETTETTPEVTMDQVFAESGIQSQAAEFNQSVQQAPVTPAPTYTPPVPDATLDPEGFNQYNASQHAAQNFQVTQLQEQLGQVNEQLTRLNTDREQETLQSDINRAVSTLKSHAEGIDQDLLLGQLHVRSQSDPMFAQIWANRAQNPQALDKALAVIGSDLKKKIPTIDPEIAEAQRALNTSSMTTTTTSDDELDIDNNNDFLAAMRKL